MFAIDPRAARAAWTVLLLALLVATAYAIREVLAVFLIALLFGYLLSPLVGLVERYTPRRISFTLSLGIVYLILIGAIIGLALTLGSRLVDEINSLATQLPDLLQSGNFLNRIPLPYWLEPLRDRIVASLRSEFSGGATNFLPYVKSLSGHLISGAKYVVYLVLVPILAFFFLKDGREIQQDIVNNLVDENRRPIVKSILADVDVLLGEYIRALVLLSLSSFTANVVFLELTGAPFAVLLAALSGLGEFLPVVGPAGAGIIVLLVSTLAGYAHPFAYILFWGLIRLMQDYALSPYLMGRGVRLNPMLVLFGVFAGEHIAGIVGMFLSVPIMATLRVIFVRLRRARAKDILEVKE